MKKMLSPSGFLLTFFFLVSFQVFGQKDFNVRYISGTISDNEYPIENVNIKVEGSARGTQTDENGFFELKVRTGEAIEFSHVGYETVVIIIEDVTKTLNLKMTQVTNTLGTAVVTARKEQTANPRIIKEEVVMDTDLRMPDGRTLNPLKSGWATAYIPKYLFDNGLPLALTLNGKVSGVTSDGTKVFIRGAEAQWIVDGNPTPMEFVPDPAIIVDMFVLKAAATIYVRTLNDPAIAEAERERKAEKYRNQNFYQDDAVAAKSSIATATPKPKLVSKPYGPVKTIRGTVNFLDSPLADVNITVEGSDRGTQTNKRGKYKIEARAGELLVYSYVGFKTVTIILEDVTGELSLDMVPEASRLEEVLITAKLNNGKVYSYTRQAEKEFKTSVGKFDPKKSGFATSYMDGNDINPASIDILEVIAGKFAGVRVNPTTREIRIRGGTGSILNDVPPIWDVDGMVIDGIPNIDPKDIKDIRLLKALGATTRYGSIAAGGVIVIQTRSGNYTPPASNSGIASEYANDNYYSDDAVQAGSSIIAMTSAIQLREQRAKETNPEVLKAIAFQFQALGLKKDAIETYKKVFKARPSYAQSYRDLANAYVENEKFKEGWRMYMAYLNQGFPASEEGIGNMVFEEMEWLYFGRNNQTNIREKFQPVSEDVVDFRNDVRFVFEWNTSEAEFDLEFVSPDRRAYVFEHTLVGNQNLINDEKRKGYSSKSFFVDDLGNGEWLMNLTYKGNKSDTPTFFKLTTYYNWGSPTQWQETRVYKLEDAQDGKLQLLRLNKQLLFASR